jgi:hypothetical protein
VIPPVPWCVTRDRTAVESSRSKEGKKDANEDGNEDGKEGGKKGGMPVRVEGPNQAKAPAQNCLKFFVFWTLRLR